HLENLLNETWRRSPRIKRRLHGKSQNSIPFDLLKGDLDRPLVLRLIGVSRVRSRTLNRDYRAKDSATDVLSFTSSEQGVLGELILCFPLLREQAHQHGLQFHEELAYMCLHGLLHLLGWDHEKSQLEAREMFLLQDTAFNKYRSRT
ncbi:MAG: rRNA maturation RNase YbeY, partial [Bdellovibrio sp.]